MTSRSLKIMAWCLPLALVVGYLLAEPLRFTTLAVALLLGAVLLTPILMRWHHPMLIIFWNAALAPTFLPGRPPVWLPLAIISFGFTMLDRSVDENKKSLSPPILTRAILFLAVVVVLTALATGGIGLAVFGSASFGGKGYYYVLGAIAGYFALAGRRIPARRAAFFAGIFFISGVSTILSNVIFTFLGPSFYFLYHIIPAEYVVSQAVATVSLTGTDKARISGAVFACISFYAFLMIRYGIRGVLDINRPWRLLLFVLVVASGLYGGFRSFLVILLISFALQFFLEGLHRTRYLGIVGVLVMLGGLVVVAFAPSLPYPVQRTLSILPIPLDPGTRMDAQISSDWRLDMWKQMLPEVPKYLLKGKGYVIDPLELHMAQENARRRGMEGSAEVAMIAGDYHNGPLSVIIPFGIYGAVAFLWLLIAGTVVLYRNYRWGDPALKKINTFLLGYFITRALFFLLCFGAFNIELCIFTGLLGLGVSLNGGMARPSSLQGAHSARNVLIKHRKNGESVEKLSTSERQHPVMGQTLDQ